MRPLLLKILAATIIAVLPVIRSAAQQPVHGKNLFDNGWKFWYGGAQGAENQLFDDSGWRNIDLPHDWSIEDLPGTSSPFSKNAVSQVSGGFTTGGTGWYRKTFTVPSSQKDRVFMIYFEGVYMNSEVWLNGKRLGDHPYGYTGFWFDLTRDIIFGGDNLLSVKVKNEGENSRWYSGSGIYRHVWLYVLSPVHANIWGTYITTHWAASEEASVRIRTTVRNSGKESSGITVVTRITDQRNAEAGRKETRTVLEPGNEKEIDVEIKISRPELWSPETPALYQAVTEISENGNQTDITHTNFGIRTISVDAVNGFLLNGKPVKLKGGCIHHDNGPLGARAFDRAEERKAELLKASGFNAVRSSHNPPSAAFLKACDKLGILVIDEAFDMWNEPKNPFDYHLWYDEWWKKDIESMVFRDRNHPSVIMWSIGNEIPNRHKPEVAAKAKIMTDYVKSLDPTRPVTAAVNDLKPDKDPFFAALDIAGYNYASGGDHNQESLYEQDHRRIPERIMLGTESYPLEAFGSWMDVIDNSFVIGDFVWTAFDYIGEASIGWRGYWQKQDFFPWNLAFCGDIDICGWKRPQSYYRDALWKQNQLSVWVTPPEPSFSLNTERQSWSKWHWYDAVDDWNWKGQEGKPLGVNVYSSCERVELFLNGKSLGIKPTNRSTRFMAAWQVPYQPGTLKAIGYTGRKQTTVSELKTAGNPVRIKMSADRTIIKADGQDLCYITVEITDENGLRDPKAVNTVSFTIEGPATIAGVGNANPVSLESLQLPIRQAWHGRCLLIVRSGTKAGKVTLKAMSPGLLPASIEIESSQQPVTGNM